MMKSTNMLMSESLETAGMEIFDSFSENANKTKKICFMNKIHSKSLLWDDNNDSG